jgi:hypothetical protein
VNLVEPVPDELTIVGTRRGDLFEKRRKLMGSPGGLPHYAKKRRRWCHCASGRCLERMVLPGIVSALSVLRVRDRIDDPAIDGGLTPAAAMLADPNLITR